MEERIHAYCWPLCRKFTFAEWRAYLREHPGSCSEPVATINGWQYNIHGVCLNCEQVAEVKGTEGDYVRLKICQEWRDKTGADRTLVWAVHAEMSVGTWGAYNFSAPEYARLEDRDSAVLASLRWCRAVLLDRQAVTGEPYTSRFATMLAGVEAELDDKMQLKLF